MFGVFCFGTMHTGWTKNKTHQTSTTSELSDLQVTQRSTASASSSKSSKRKAKSPKENSSTSDAEAASTLGRGPNAAATSLEEQQVRLMVRECIAATRP